MAIEKDVQYIKKGFDEFKHEDRKIHEELKNTINEFVQAVDLRFKNKADKDELDELQSKLWKIALIIGGVLLSIIGFLFSKII